MGKYDSCEPFTFQSISKMRVQVTAIDFSSTRFDAFFCNFLGHSHKNLKWNKEPQYKKFLCLSQS